MDVESLYLEGIVCLDQYTHILNPTLFGELRN